MLINAWDYEFSNDCRTIAASLVSEIAECSERLKGLPDQFLKLGSAEFTGEQAILSQADEAGRLMADAMDKGAWAWSVTLKEFRELTIGQDSDYAGFWILVHQHWIGIINPHRKSVGRSIGQAEIEPVELPIDDTKVMLSGREFGAIAEMNPSQVSRDIPHEARTLKRAREIKREHDARRVKRDSQATYRAIRDAKKNADKN